MSKSIDATASECGEKNSDGGGVIPVALAEELETLDMGIELVFTVGGILRVVPVEPGQQVLWQVWP